MRSHKALLVTAFLITAEIVAARVTTNAQRKAFQPTTKGNNAVSSEMLFTPVAHKNADPLEQAVQDAINIFSKKNSCSRFYGDPQTTVEVLRRLAIQFQIHPLRDSRTGIEMSGKFTYFDQTENHGGFRLFTAATINKAGPFFKAKVFPAEPSVISVGSFRPNTREARVPMLLHELAHLVKGQDGSWLIPDDGNAPALSKRNTELVESQCRPQILRLGNRLPGTKSGGEATGGDRRTANHKLSGVSYAVRLLGIPKALRTIEGVGQ